ncbi:MAG: hypothetical protein DI623_11405 [Sphingomonas sanxanigenens]|uniref:Uncharacterized protein n=1 Tax=Sphingomonas sanxanigenens TaxID=397260 RepID=A0A2W5C4J3_9SPHN|nr:MAG: hypothetical protein DI623_11405 [Sphingomonas sanxanigenens]
MGIETLNDTIKYQDGKGVSREAGVVVVARGIVDLASDVSLAAAGSDGDATEPVGGISAGTYIFDLLIGEGDSPELALERLAPDGATWIAIDGLDALSSDFAPGPVTIGQGATLRLVNTSVNSVAGVYARLS